MCPYANIVHNTVDITVELYFSCDEKLCLFIAKHPILRLCRAVKNPLAVMEVYKSKTGFLMRWYKYLITGTFLDSITHSLVF